MNSNNNNIGKQIAKNIVARRKTLNVTQEQLAERSGLSINFISRIERGVSTHISAVTLYNISKSLNISMEDLINKEISMTQHPGPFQAKLNKYLSKLSLAQSEALCKQVLNLINDYHLE